LLPGLLGVTIAATSASAQYFGRNKVQFETFHFEVMHSQRFDVHFYPEEIEPTRDATRMLERWFTRESSVLHHEFRKKPVILYANHADFQQTNVIGGEIDEGTGGVTESMRSRIVLPFTGVYADNDHVLGHELVHAFQYDIAATMPGGGPNAMERLPLWVVEGMAEYLSLGRVDPHTAMWLRDAALRNDLPTITQLTTDPRYFPYRYGQALWAYIAGRWGDEMVNQLFRGALRVGWDQALVNALHMRSDSLSKVWHQAIKDAYLPLMDGRTKPQDAGEPVIVQKDASAMNVSPVVSPDGRYVAFVSRRSLFSIDLYLADAHTGKVLRTLASPQSGTHFDDISFIAASGAWSPDSKEFAFIVFADGDNQIAILNAETRDVERQIRVPGVGGILSVAWSPDGKDLAFSGTAGGVSDLYVVDVAGQTVRRLTNDRYADLLPAWSPDGRTLAFSTDRGTGTTIDDLQFSPLRLALLDVSTGAIRTLSVFTGAKHINPQYSPDGRDLYFVSDRDGFSDIYRLTLATSEVSRVTRLATGVSGITYLSPAISVAQGTGRILFSVFEHGGNNIYGLDADRARGQPVVAGMADTTRAGRLPPGDLSGIVTAYLADATTGLPPGRDFPITPYKAALSLEYLGQPSLGVGVSSYGAVIGGSVSAYFGDMLGNRTLGTALQGTGTAKDLGGEIFYLDADRRWNWLASAGHYSQLTGSATAANSVAQGVPVRTISQYYRRILTDQATGMVQYPFSKTRRVEFGVAAVHVAYNTQVQRFVQVGNGISAQGIQDTLSPPSISYASGTVALVGDNSFNGFTSPIQGARYRLEATPTFGGIDFVGVLADARRYFFARPVTLAVRGMHIGRYGAGGEDARVSPLYVGYGTLVRGYDANSFDSSECTQTGSGASPTQCPAFDRLLGSRLAIANAELRIPLFGSSQFGLIHWNFVPIEIAPFVDAGVAWTSTESPELTFSTTSAARIPVVASGVSGRVNLLGFAILEVYWAHPYQRPLMGHVWGFQILPGW
jgi:Tol biopolymer transport system component